MKMLVLLFILIPGCAAEVAAEVVEANKNNVTTIVNTVIKWTSEEKKCDKNSICCPGGVNHCAKGHRVLCFPQDGVCCMHCGGGC